MSAGCETNPAAAALKKTNEKKYKAIAKDFVKMAPSSRPAKTTI